MISQFVNRRHPTHDRDRPNSRRHRQGRNKRVGRPARNRQHPEFPDSEAVNDTLGAPTGDPNFLQQCMDVLKCAFDNNCAYGSAGPAQCYCGSNDANACVQNGPASDAKCVAQFQAGARSTVVADVAARASDFAYPLGWATTLLQCDSDNCRTPDVGQCIP